MNRWSSFVRPVIQIGLLVLAVAFLGLSGCATLNRPDPDRRYYLLQVQRSQPAVERPSEAPILAVRAFRVAPASDSRGIVTIRADGLVQRDFYERFFLPPGEMLAGQFRNWLGQAGFFSLVTDMGGLTEPDLILEGYVQELHRDQRFGRLRAVLALQVLLLRPTRAGAVEVVLQRDFSQEVDLPDGSIRSLVAGWNLALERILDDVEAALRESPLLPSDGNRLQGADQ